jgi:hypothetical protein
LMPYSWHAARFDHSPVSTRRGTSVHISIAADTPRASLSVGEIAALPRFYTPGPLRSCALHFSTDRATPPRAALFDRRSQSRHPTS